MQIVWLFRCRVCLSVCLSVGRALMIYGLAEHEAKWCTVCSNMTWLLLSNLRSVRSNMPWLLPSNWTSGIIKGSQQSLQLWGRFNFGDWSASDRAQWRLSCTRSPVSRITVAFPPLSLDWRNTAEPRSCLCEASDGRVSMSTQAYACELLWRICKLSRI